MTSSGRRDLRLNSFLPYVLANLAERVSSSLSHIYADEFQLTIPEWRGIANLAERRPPHARPIVDLTLSLLTNSPPPRPYQISYSLFLFKKKQTQNHIRSIYLHLTNT